MLSLSPRGHPGTHTGNNKGDRKDLTRTEIVEKELTRTKMSQLGNRKKSLVVSNCGTHS